MLGVAWLRWLLYVAFPSLFLSWPFGGGCAAGLWLAFLGFARGGLRLLWRFPVFWVRWLSCRCAAACAPGVEPSSRLWLRSVCAVRWAPPPGVESPSCNTSLFSSLSALVWAALGVAGAGSAGLSSGVWVWGRGWGGVGIAFGARLGCQCSGSAAAFSAVWPLALVFAGVPEGLHGRDCAWCPCNNHLSGPLVRAGRRAAADLWYRLGSLLSLGAVPPAWAPSPSAPFFAAPAGAEGEGFRPALNIPAVAVAAAV